MSEEAERWKEKYLQLVERQDQLEARWEQRVDLLRRSLVRSSLAVEGADPAVERCLHAMREVLREGDLDDGLSQLVPRLEKAVLDSERYRQERAVRLTEALHRLVAQLLALSPPPELRKPIKRFAKQLDQRAAQLRELPGLLGELSVLQGQVLTLQEDAAPQQGGFLKRLFGGRDSQLAAIPLETAIPAGLSAPAEVTLAAEAVVGGETAVASAATEAVVAVVAPILAEPANDEQQAVEPVSSAAEPDADAVEAGADADADAELAPVAEPLPPESAYALPDSPEPAFSVVADRVEATLSNLLDNLHLPEQHQPQLQTLRARIQHGLNWYELVPVLDDLAMLMIAFSDQGQRDFESYLQTLNERLSAMQENLLAAHQGHSEGRDAAQALDEELREQVGGLQHSMRQATDLTSLKKVVEARLDGLLDTVDTYRQQRSQQEQKLGERLQQLVSRVGSLEQAARGLRGHLEEQRQKALQDPLTGLPNRAAWNERLDLEFARWQRYGGDLLLAVLDVDHFKRVNDGYGHLAGDRVLKIIGSELRKRLRKTDFIARFGGEEFVVLLPNTPYEAGQQLMDALRDSISNCPFHFKGERIVITLSAGLTAFGEDDTTERAFERADGALYRAKNAGRNRVELA
ncbi:GGDEF domain-containing protein [Stutzerimonas stutzeri]|jgi:diguanylate cyclase|uniref:diguanylate cyclase n=1 Tax=Stutzerimonas stutzeri RCH2 TaxID=644801 RepID=L0GHK6_STUST|nr:GGDEF domain-containing protein [Stutzerimonas stutzeri]AGA84799.1 diguanylate cyclase (GGDEF) domain-containing protein [Stutzerimonas stutzeri RCH2]